MITLWSLWKHDTRFLIYAYGDRDGVSGHTLFTMKPLCNKSFISDFTASILTGACCHGCMKHSLIPVITAWLALAICCTVGM